MYDVCKSSKKVEHEFSGLLQTCMQLEHRSMTYSMYNRAWGKSCTNAVRHGENQKGYIIFLSGPGGTGKSHVVHLTQRDMSHFFKHTLKPDDDQPIVFITVPTGSATFQIGGSTIHSAFLYMIIINLNLVGRREVRCN